MNLNRLVSLFCLLSLFLLAACNEDNELSPFKSYEVHLDVNAANYALNGKQVQESQVAHNYSNKVTYHHLNAFYILDKNNYTLSSYADYIHNNNDYNQNTNENVDNGKDINTVSVGNGKQDMSSLKIDYTQIKERDKHRQLVL